MGRIPVRFQRVAAAFDADAARVRLCESSGSEHSPENSATDLSVLVKSFMERAAGAGAGAEGEDDDAVVVLHDHKDREGEEDLDKFEWSDSEKRAILQGLFAGNEGEEFDDQNAKQKIRGEVELAWSLVGDKSSPGFKRRLMSRLRDRGFDAGLCKSKWERNGRLPAGDYEYIDVNFAGKRYIVEVSLAAEFEIARPTDQYSSLLEVFPTVFVGKVEELKRVLRIMCTAMRDSMKSTDLHIPPWRRNEYMQAKWFSSYRRTTNEVATGKASPSPPPPPPPPPLSFEAFSPKRSIGFEARPPVKSYNCRDEYVSKTVLRVGNLTAAFGADGFGMQL